MRSLIVATILCLAATPAFACVYDSECKSGSTCLDGLCRAPMYSTDDGSDNAPTKRVDGKSCAYDDDCRQGSRCIKGSGLSGVCIGH
jgi:hypothetical protein